MEAERAVFCFLRLEKLSFPQIASLVSQEDRDYALQFRELERSTRALAGRALRKWCLKTYLGISDPWIRTTEHGKPYVLGEPGFNCATTPGLVAVALISQGEIGVDVEATVRGRALGMSAADLQVWTDREAVAKGHGLGLVLATEGLSDCGDGCYRINECHEKWQTMRPKLPREWVGSVALLAHRHWILQTREVKALELLRDLS